MKGNMANKQKPTVITATEMQKLSGQIIKRAFKGEHFIVERAGLPTVAIISVKDYKMLQSHKAKSKVTLS